MRPRSLTVLALVVVALLAFVWFFERDQPSSDERRELVKRVLRLDSEEVTALELSFSEQRVRLERSSAAAAAGTEPGWWLREPIAARADAAAVGRLLDALTALEKERTLSEADRAELGLAEPRARVTLTTAEGETRLLVGAAVPVSSTLMLEVEGRSEFYVVSDSFLADVTRGPGAWRDRDVGVGSRDAVTRIDLAGPDGAIRLGRRDRDFWLETPYADRADRDLTSALLGALSGLRAESFLDVAATAPAELGLEPPLAVVEATLDGHDRPWRLELGDPGAAAAGRRPARLGGQLFEIGSALDEALARPASAWRSRSWTSFEAYEVDRLTVSGDGGEMTLYREAGDWLRDGETIAYTPVSDLLYALSGIEAESFVGDPGAAGEPALTLILDGDGRVETLTLSATRDNGRRARVSDRPVALVLAEGAVSDLELKLDEVRTAPALGAADEIDLEIPVGG